MFYLGCDRRETVIRLPVRRTIELPHLSPSSLFDSSMTTTTSGRPDYDVSPLKQYDKDRATKADPNGGLCLITNTRHSINACHCIRRAMMKNEEIVCVY